MRNILISFLLCLAAGATLLAQTTLVNRHKAVGRIIVEDTALMPAAGLLQDFVGRISDAKMPIVSGPVKNIRKGDAVIRRAADSAVTEDAFRLSTMPGYLIIEGGKGKGAEYGVITLLERYLGCNYWGEHDMTVPRAERVKLPAMNYVERPAFRYRQSQNYAFATDPMYRLWMRLEEPSDEFANGMWVHTFNRLLPAAQYGDEHPEYYAWFDGKRHPGAAVQWCLTNDEVFETVAARIDSIFKANPDRTMISVSQNDGNRTNCTCEKCLAIDTYEGAPSGSLIHFLNRLADRFPDKQFSTLAYLYTMQPPKHVKPRPNVNIMLCDIDVYREVPLGDNASGREFLKALEGWSKISDNIFVWDYGINFDGLATPFPNFHIMAPNIRTFRDHNVKMHFSQLAGMRGGDLSELRTWMVSKLMWNPDADPDSLMTTFVEGYYGPAAPYMQKYISMLEGGLIGSRIPLWIYDSPVTHRGGMLNPIACREYNRLFDAAERAVASDSALLARVQRSRLSLQYSELDMARTEPDKDVVKLAAMLDTFEVRSARYGMPMVNERNNKPSEYVALYRERYLPKPGSRPNLAAGAAVTFSNPVPAPYDKIAATALTDGIYGGATFKDSWIGWEGKDVSLTLDLGRDTLISSLNADFLHQLGAWILLPKSVTYYISNDGKDWRGGWKVTLPEDSDPRVKFTQTPLTLPEGPQRARYVKLDIEATKYCPHWHYGVGNTCWVFIDEVTVN